VTMTIPEAPFPLAQGKGALASHTTIVAMLCSDMGVEVACIRCGHTFVASKPLSDESEEADSIELAKALWFHRCEDEGRKWREVQRSARSTKHRP
jgi:hypothetical protein